MSENSYSPKEIEQKWQRIWEEQRTFEVSQDSQKKKFYILEMFPYPSGRLHMGHVRNYTLGDVLNRYKKMKGFNVLHPIGWDAFGLPAENAAIKNKVDPEKWTRDNISYMRKQLKAMGLGYDWSREFATCDAKYYKWNQWFFIKFMEKGLVYRKKSFVNFCPSCNTVLANEQVEQGLCWRCDSEVIQKELEQWYFKITDYTEQLLEGHKLLAGNWADKILAMQKNWIGKSFGAQVDFSLLDSDKIIKVFTTRPDTICGVTYLVLAPEHPWVAELTKGTKYEREINNFVEKIKKQNKIARTAENVKKEGMFAGVYCLNPITGDKIPVWVANYVLLEYGTGAVMAVPAHDKRDFAFALEYKLPIKEVISPDGQPTSGPLKEAFVDDGIMINSGQFNGISSNIGIKKVTDYLSQIKKGKAVVNYRLRDWLISRQRYWGTPIPIIYCAKCGIMSVPAKDLPVLLPKNVQFTGAGESPLKQVKDFVETVCPKCGGKATRETDTMDTFVDSSWYYARYCDSLNDRIPFSSEHTDYWLPVDQYIGGAEHACMHLIYARFFHKVMRDLGLLKGDEPFLRLLNQGMVTLGGTAMSKSKGNIVDPDHIIEKYGADTMRLFILFASPPEKDLEYSDTGIEGAWRFLNRIWRLVEKINQPPIKESPAEVQAQKELQRKMHSAIKKITQDLERDFGFNTAIAGLMELVNTLHDLEGKVSLVDFKEAVKTLLILLSPFTPHIAEELWQRLGNSTAIAQLSWPSYDEKLIMEEQVEIAVQINGKVRSRISIEANLSEQEIKNRAMMDEKIKQVLADKRVLKSIYVPKKLVNIVLNNQ